MGYGIFEKRSSNIFGDISEYDDDTDQVEWQRFEDRVAAHVTSTRSGEEVERGPDLLVNGEEICPDLVTRLVGTTNYQLVVECKDRSRLSAEDVRKVEKYVRLLAPAEGAWIFVPERCQVSDEVEWLASELGIQLYRGLGTTPLP